MLFENDYRPAHDPTAVPWLSPVSPPARRSRRTDCEVAGCTWVDGLCIDPGTGGPCVVGTLADDEQGAPPSEPGSVFDDIFPELDLKLPDWLRWPPWGPTTPPGEDAPPTPEPEQEPWWRALREVLPGGGSDDWRAECTGCPYETGERCTISEDTAAELTDYWVLLTCLDLGFFQVQGCKTVGECWSQRP